MQDTVIEKPLEDWGKWVGEYCKENNMSHVEFAREVNLTPDTVWRWTTRLSNGSIRVVKETLDALGYEIVIRRK